MPYKIKIKDEHLYMALAAGAGIFGIWWFFLRNREEYSQSNYQLQNGSHPQSGQSSQPPTHASKEPALVLFTRDGCPPCEALKSVWNDVKNELVQGGFTNIIEVEVSENNMSNIPKDIAGTPTIRFYPNGFVPSDTRYTQFSERREVENILRFIADNLRELN